jgi:hypothetical protein
MCKFENVKIIPVRHACNFQCSLQCEIEGRAEVFANFPICTFANYYQTPAFLLEIHFFPETYGL